MACVLTDSVKYQTLAVLRSSVRSRLAPPASHSIQYLAGCINLVRLYLRFLSQHLARCLGLFECDVTLGHRSTINLN